MIPAKPDDLVVEKRGRLRRGPAITRLARQALGDFGASATKCRCQNFVLQGHIPAAKRGQPLGNGTAIDDRARVRDNDEIGLRHASSWHAPAA